jgi:hypothetical protein
MWASKTLTRLPVLPALGCLRSVGRRD